MPSWQTAGPRKGGGREYSVCRGGVKGESTRNLGRPDEKGEARAACRGESGRHRRQSNVLSRSPRRRWGEATTAASAEGP